MKKSKTEIIAEEYNGKVLPSTKCGNFIVRNYVNCKHVEIEFVATGYKTISQMKEVRNGMVNDPTAKIVHGVGCFGIGPYVGTVNTADGKKKNSPAYEVWHGILRRCYSENKHDMLKFKPYRFVEVHKDWLNFQNFAKWFYDNLPSYPNPELDKDLRVIGSKEYGPDTCSFVPPAVNSLFTGYVDRELPRGVHFCNTKKVYVAQLHKGEETRNGTKRQTFLGYYKTKEPAIAAYRKAKIEHVVEVAERYKDVLHISVYNNLINKTAEIIKHENSL